MVLTVGELINTSCKAVAVAVEDRDVDYIKDIAIKQARAGADYIDVNCGTRVDDEPETMVWLVQTIQSAVEKPLCIDSANSEAIEAGLTEAKEARPMVNSITAESNRYGEVLALVVKYSAKVIALCMDDNAIPDTASDRLRIANWLVNKLIEAGVRKEDIYLDPLVIPLSTSDLAGLDVLETIRAIKAEHPEVHTICGLSNISFGLPNRKVLNQTFLIQTMTAGMDAYVLNPLDRMMMGLLYTSEALLGQDEYCRRYLEIHRKGLYL